MLLQENKTHELAKRQIACETEQRSEVDRGNTIQAKNQTLDGADCQLEMAQVVGGVDEIRIDALPVLNSLVLNPIDFRNRYIVDVLYECGLLPGASNQDFLAPVLLRLNSENPDKNEQ